MCVSARDYVRYWLQNKSIVYRLAYIAAFRKNEEILESVSVYLVQVRLAYPIAPNRNSRVVV